MSDASTRTAALPVDAATSSLLALLTGGEGIAAALLAHVAPAEWLAFKCVCRHFRRALALVHGSETATRTPLAALVAQCRPVLMDWALSMGLPWPAHPARVVLNLAVRAEGGAAGEAGEAGEAGAPLPQPRPCCCVLARLDPVLLSERGGGSEGWPSSARLRFMDLAAGAACITMLRW